MCGYLQSKNSSVQSRGPFPIFHLDSNEFSKKLKASERNIEVYATALHDKHKDLQDIKPSENTQF